MHRTGPSMTGTGAAMADTEPWRASPPQPTRREKKTGPSFDILGNGESRAGRRPRAVEGAEEFISAEGIDFRVQENSEVYNVKK